MNYPFKREHTLVNKEIHILKRCANCQPSAVYRLFPNRLNYFFLCVVNKIVQLEKEEQRVYTAIVANQL